MKSAFTAVNGAPVTGRTPSGVRGLKFGSVVGDVVDVIKSHPVRGAWIEILYARIRRFSFSSHPVRGAWIEIVIQF